MEYKCKISIVGDEYVGKTSIIIRYIKNTFSSKYITTLGADFIDMTFTHSNIPKLNPKGKLTITVWDIGGQKHFKDISSLYCEGSAGMMIVFDVSNIESFKSIPKWIEFANETCPKSKIVIIGNKIDLESTIDLESRIDMEEKIGHKIYYSSAKVDLSDEKSNINNIFEIMAKELLTDFLS